MTSKRKKPAADRDRQFDVADKLLKMGKLTQAARIIEKPIEDYPDDKKSYEAASFLYWSNSLYPQAKKIHARYEAQFGKKLKSDVGLEELESEEKNVESQLKGVRQRDKWVFEAKFLAWRRWFRPGLIHKLELSPAGLRLWDREGEKKIAWTEVIRADLIVDDWSKSSIVSCLVLRTRSKDYVFGDSYFKDGWLLLEKAVPTFIRVRRKKIAINWWFRGPVSLASLTAVMFGQVYSGSHHQKIAWGLNLVAFALLMLVIWDHDRKMRGR